MATADHIFRYGRPSAIDPRPSGPTLALASDTEAADGAPRQFLAARLLAPDITAKGLRGVSDIVGARFYVPPAMLAKILRLADPVATVSPGTVRFEGFSACCSTYARMDLGDGALDAQVRRNGTTNVDFGPELRAALATVTPGTTMDLAISAEAVDVTRDGARVVERKVPLPLRWVKGFAQVQVVLANMRPAFSLSRVAAQRFLRALPRGKSDHVQWVALRGGAAHVTPRESAASIPLRGSERLRVLEPMVAQSNALDVFHDPLTGATGWVLDFGTQRFCLVLNAEPWRGFSGDGGLLSRIAASDGSATTRIRAWLNWQDAISGPDLATATGLDPETISGALAELAALGLLGYDLKQESYFHRVLPFDLNEIAALNPRLGAAEALVEAGAVTLQGEAAQVTSSDVVHQVTRDGERWRCTCPWYAKNGAQRGPCKHILAVEMEQEKNA